MSRGAALVTGARARLGRALALALGAAGYGVAVHHRGDHAADARAVVDEIRAAGGMAQAVQADLADEAETASLIGRAAEAIGPLTLLINNASRFTDDRVGSLSAESWVGHMAVNLRAPIVLAETFAAQAPAGADALVINLLDQRVWKPNPQFFSYTLSKCALWSATQMLAQALAPRVRVNAIGPGPTLPSVHQDAAAFEAEAAATPLGRAVALDEITAAALYLIDARSTTGQMIAVDGGQHLAWRTPDIPHD